MPQAIRSQNFNLMRWLNGGHDYTAQKLSHLTNANYVSKMATGDMEISDDYARSIETAIEYPHGWLDRDNIAILKMSPVEVNIHLLVTTLSEEKKLALLELLSP